MLSQYKFSKPMPFTTSCFVPDYCHRTISILLLRDLSMTVSSAINIPRPDTFDFEASHTSFGLQFDSANHLDTLSWEIGVGDTSDNAFAVYRSLVTRKNALYNSLLHLERPMLHSRMTFPY